MNPYFERYLRGRYGAADVTAVWPGRRPQPPMPPQPPVPRPPVPPPPPEWIPGIGPFYVYQCRYYSTADARNYCSFTVASQFPAQPECNTIVGGPFYTMQDAEAFILWRYGVRREETFSC